MTPEDIEKATDSVEVKQTRPTPDELAKLVSELCKSHGYRQMIIAIGKKSGQPSPAIDVIADTHYIDIAYVEIER